MANLVLQLSPLNLMQTQLEKHLHSIHKKGPIITYLIEPCYLFTVVAKPVSYTHLTLPTTPYV